MKNTIYSIITFNQPSLLTYLLTYLLTFPKKTPKIKNLRVTICPIPYRGAFSLVPKCFVLWRSWRYSCEVTAETKTSGWKVAQFQRLDESPAPGVKEKKKQSRLSPPSLYLWKPLAQSCPFTIKVPRIFHNP